METILRENNSKQNGPVLKSIEPKEPIDKKYPKISIYNETCIEEYDKQVKKKPESYIPLFPIYDDAKSNYADFHSYNNGVIVTNINKYEFSISQAHIQNTLYNHVIYHNNVILGIPPLNIKDSGGLIKHDCYGELNIDQRIFLKYINDCCICFTSPSNEEHKKQGIIGIIVIIKKDLMRIVEIDKNNKRTGSTYNFYLGQITYNIYEKKYLVFIVGRKYSKTKSNYRTFFMIDMTSGKVIQNRMFEYDHEISTIVMSLGTNQIDKILHLIMTNISKDVALLTMSFLYDHRMF